MYAPVPPVALAVNPPSAKPLQVALLSTTTLAAIAVSGSVIVTTANSGPQSFASSTVTTYIPAVNPVAVAVVCPSGQA